MSLVEVKKCEFDTVHIHKTICSECGHEAEGLLDTCPECGSKNLDMYTRVIGYFSKVAGWSKPRRLYDFPNRKFTTNEQLCEELGK